MSHLDGTGGGVTFSDCRRGGIPGARARDNSIVSGISTRNGLTFQIIKKSLSTIHPRFIKKKYIFNIAI